MAQCKKREKREKDIKGLNNIQYNALMFFLNLYICIAFFHMTTVFENRYFVRL
jgi:hypothetical protein